MSLIAIIAQLQATVLEQQRVIERLERRVAELEGQAKPGGPPRMPSLKSSSGRQRSSSPSKQRRHGFARPRMTPTHRVEHVVESCPDCGTHLTGGWVQRTREVIELPVVPVPVTEHVFIARTCPACRRRRSAHPQHNWTAWHWGANAWASTCSAASPRYGKKGACRSAASSGICAPSISCASAWGPL